MATPSLPWYGAIERGLRPIDQHLSVALMLVAVACVVVAWKGDAVLKMAFLIYLISP